MIGGTILKVSQSFIRVKEAKIAAAKIILKSHCLGESDFRFF